MAEYIEREAAIKEFSNNGSIFVYGKQECKAIVSRINAIHAADVRPVVRARWKHRKDSAWNGGGCMECSACGFGYSDKYYHEVEEFDFCPNCGAEMEGN